MSAGPALFRLHLPYGVVIEGFTQADGTAVAVDDAEYGLTSSAASAKDLLRGYGGRRIEWLAPKEGPRDL